MNSAAAKVAQVAQQEKDAIVKEEIAVPEIKTEEIVKEEEVKA